MSEKREYEEVDFNEVETLKFFSQHFEEMLENAIEEIFIPNNAWPLEYGIKILTVSGRETGKSIYIKITAENFRKIQKAAEYYRQENPN